LDKKLWKHGKQDDENLDQVFNPAKTFRIFFQTNLSLIYSNLYVKLIIQRTSLASCIIHLFQAFPVPLLVIFLKKDKTTIKKMLDNNIKAILRTPAVKGSV